MKYNKAQANLDDGINYEILHYETQLGQVKVMDASGNPISDLNEMMFEGKQLNAPDLSTIKLSGKYRVKGGTSLPAGVDLTKTYAFKVDAVDVGNGVIVVHQEFYDHVNQEVHHRTINGTTIGSWIKIGKSMAEQVSKIGNLENLYTIKKDSVVDAINSLSAELQVVTDINQGQMQGEIDELENKLNTHNHDSKYLSLSGGSLTSTVAVANEKSFAGKNTSGSNLNIGKVNGVNDVVIGDVTAKTIVQAKSGDISLSDGTNTHKLFHSGNDGSGSGMDADTVDGVHGSQLARTDATNYLSGDQYVEEGKNIVLRASEGSSQAGILSFRDGSNNQKGKLSVNTDGDMSFFAGAINGHTMRSNGELFSNYKHILDATSRENSLAFKRGSADAGIGLVMSTSGVFNMYDWENGRKVFGVNRNDNVVEFSNSIRLAGAKLTIQKLAPATPSTGDIWIGI